MWLKANPARNGLTAIQQRPAAALTAAPLQFWSIQENSMPGMNDKLQSQHVRVRRGRQLDVKRQLGSS